MIKHVVAAVLVWGLVPGSPWAGPMAGAGPIAEAGPKAAQPSGDARSGPGRQVVAGGPPAVPQVQASPRSRRLLEALAGAADAEEAARTRREIELEWSRSGSAAMDLLLRRGREALEAGDSATAVGHLTALTDHAPDFAQGWYLRALAFYQQGRLGMALADLERTLALNPWHFGAMQGVGAVLEQMGDVEGAHDAYLRALAIDPHDGELRAAAERLRPLAVGRDL